MIGEYPAFLPQRLHGLEERLQPLRVHVRRARSRAGRRPAPAPSRRGGTAPRPDRSSSSSVSPQSVRSCGVSVARASVTGANAETMSDSGAVTSRCAPFVGPRRLHRQGVLADRDADAEPRAQLQRDRAHGVEERGVLAGMPRRRHPVGGELDVADVGDRRRGDVGDAPRRSPCGRTPRDSISASGVRSPIANASPRQVSKPISVTATSATGTCHGPTIWSRAVRPPTRAVADRDEERLVGDRRAAAARGRPPRADRCRPSRTAAAPAARASTSPRHPRRLAEQHRELHVDRRVAEHRVGHRQPAVARRAPDDRERTALALADRAKTLEVAGRDREHVALLRLVAPDLQRRHAGLFAGNRAQVEAAAAPAPRAPARAARSTGRPPRRRVSRGSDWPRPAPSSGRSLPARGAGSRRCRAAPNRNRGLPRSCRSSMLDAAPPPSPISIPGPPSWMRSAPTGSSRLCTCAAAMLPTPPAIMIGL